MGDAGILGGRSSARLHAIGYPHHWICGVGSKIGGPMHPGPPAPRLRQEGLAKDRQACGQVDGQRHSGPPEHLRRPPHPLQAIHGQEDRLGCGPCIRGIYHQVKGLARLELDLPGRSELEHLQQVGLQLPKGCLGPERLDGAEHVQPGQWHAHPFMAANHLRAELDE